MMDERGAWSFGARMSTAVGIALPLLAVRADASTGGNRRAHRFRITMFAVHTSQRLSFSFAIR
jgi:hypothetical protein